MKIFQLIFLFLPSFLHANPYFPNLQPCKSVQKSYFKSSIVVFPKKDSTSEKKRDPWMGMIRSAKKSIQLVAYHFPDPLLVKALCERAQNGVKVEIVLEKKPYMHKYALPKDSLETNTPRDAESLKQAEIKVSYLPERYGSQHAKYMIIDGKEAVISTGNIDSGAFGDSKNHNGSRDFAVLLNNPELLHFLKKVFAADSTDQLMVMTHPQIIIGPEEQRSTMLCLISAARKSIRIYQQDLQDKVIAGALARFAKGGGKLEIIMRPNPFSLKTDPNIPNQRLIQEVGGKIFLIEEPYIHAKILIIDAEDKENAVMYLGSGNFYPLALESAREVGILIDQLSLIQEVLSTFNKDKRCSDKKSRDA